MFQVFTFPSAPKLENTPETRTVAMLNASTGSTQQTVWWRYSCKWNAPQNRARDSQCTWNHDVKSFIVFSWWDHDVNDFRGFFFIEELFMRTWHWLLVFTLVCPTTCKLKPKVQTSDPGKKLEQSYENYSYLGAKLPWKLNVCLYSKRGESYWSY